MSGHGRRSTFWDPTCLNTMCTGLCRCQKTFTYRLKDLESQADGGDLQQFVTLRLQPDVICSSSTGCLLWSAGLKLAEFVFSNPTLFKGASATALMPLAGKLSLDLMSLTRIQHPSMAVYTLMAATPIACSMWLEFATALKPNKL